jgi:hypothetical protein
MKRLIRMAVEEGYDKVAWATGEQQADLYDMRSHIGSVAAKPDRDGASGLVDVTFGNYDANRVLYEQNDNSALFTRDKLVELLGGTLGGRIYDEGMKATHVEPFFTEDVGDLQVGGEGHKAFYNRNLVNITNDLIKKFGAKVGVVELPNESVVSERDLDARQAAADAAAKALNDWSAAHPGLALQDLDARYRELADRVASLSVGEEGPGIADVAEQRRLVSEATEELERVEEDHLNLRHLERELRWADEALAETKARLEPRKQWGFEVTDKMRAEDAAVQPPLFQGDDPLKARGAFNPQTNTITLLKGADLSTFLHETGHFFLETLARLAAERPRRRRSRTTGPRPASSSASAARTRRPGWPSRWTLAARATRSGRAASRPTCARARPPAPQLQGAVPALPVLAAARLPEPDAAQRQLTDEVRGVFDRMLATDAEIAQAEQARAMRPCSPPSPEGMTDTEWEAYQRLGEEATATAQDELQGRSIRDMQWLQNTRARMIRQLGRRPREAQGVRAEVEAEVHGRAGLRGRPEFLKRGWSRASPSRRGRTSSPSKTAPRDLRDLPPDTPGLARKLGYGKYGMLARRASTPTTSPSCSASARATSWSSAAVRRGPQAEKIAGLTDQRMLERYGDLTTRRPSSARPTRRSTTTPACGSWPPRRTPWPRPPAKAASWPRPPATSPPS